MPKHLVERLDDVIASMDSRVAELRLASGAVPQGADAAIDIILHTPVQSMQVSSPYGLRRDPITGKKRFHAGVDIAAPAGTSVHTTAAGDVIFAGWQGGYGRHVVVEHKDGTRSHYSHLEDIFVKRGDHVPNGRVVGAVGSSGRSTGPHLHWAVTDRSGHFVDPVRALRGETPIVN